MVLGEGREELKEERGDSEDGELNKKERVERTWLERGGGGN